MNVRVVSITRQTGTGAEQVGEALAERLGFRYYDHRALQAAGEEAGLSPDAVSEAERVPSLMIRILEALALSPGLAYEGHPDPMLGPRSPMLTSAEYRHVMEDVIRRLADQGGCVLMGYSSSVVLDGRDDALRVLITGSEGKRVARLTEELDVDEKSARKSVGDSDRDRTEYFRRFYHVDWLKPANYDLCLSTDRITPLQAADLLASVVQQR